LPSDAGNDNQDGPREIHYADLVPGYETMDKNKKKKI